MLLEVCLRVSLPTWHLLLANQPSLLVTVETGYMLTDNVCGFGMVVHESYLGTKSRFKLSALSAAGERCRSL